MSLRLTEGRRHRVVDGDLFVPSERRDRVATEVIASGSAEVEIWGRVRCEASGTARVKAHGGTVIATDTVHVRAHGRVQVYAGPQVTVIARKWPHTQLRPTVIRFATDDLLQRATQEDGSAALLKAA